MGRRRNTDQSRAAREEMRPGRTWERGRREAYLLTVIVDGGVSMARAELQAQAPS
jgi:hypothetical protein